MISRTIIFVFAVVILSFLSSEAIACSCAAEVYRPGVTLEQRRMEKKEYFTNEFKGAAFLGKIIKRERANVHVGATTLDGKPALSKMFKYTIEVSSYWFGVRSQSIVVYGEPSVQYLRGYESGTSCGFALTKNETYFFTPTLYNKNLQIGLCDFAGGGSPPDGGRATEFSEIMGPPKQF